MSLNLALSTALSGLLTSQRALDVVSHNVANMNTPDFTRKVMTPESRVLAGAGVGVQVTSIQRNVDEGMLRDVRRENAKLSFLDQSNTYFTRIQSLFGEVGANSSISHLMESLSTAFDSMAADSASSSQHWGVVQAADNVVQSLQQMTVQIQDLRRQADADMQTAVEDVNRELANIADLNNKIALNSATSSGIADLQDKRDAAVDRLSQLIDISYFSRGNNMQSIFTSQGTVLVDNGPETLTHVAVSQYQPWLHTGDGTITGITIGENDITSEITSGKLKALIDMRDTNLPNLQAEIDRLSKELQDEINKIHNRGIAFPNDRTTVEGSRTFIDSSTQTVTMNGGDVSIVLFDSTGKQTARTTLETIMEDGGEAPHGPWTIDEVATNLDGWLDDQLGTGNYVTVTAEGKFSITIPPSKGKTLAFKDIDSTVFDSSLRGSATTALGIAGTLTFRDADGNVMGAALTVTSANTLTNLRDNINATVTGTVAELVADSSGNYYLRVTSSNGDPITLDDNAAKTALGLLPSGTNEAKDVSIEFDANGDGTDDQTVEGFSNFLGLNDFFDDGNENFIFESGLLSSDYTTSVATTLEFRDVTGLLGGAITIPSGSTLDEVAAQINSAAVTYDSHSSATFSGNGVLNVIHNGVSIGTLDITGLTLSQIETQINLAANSFDDFGVTADVVTQDGLNFLRIYDTEGDTLSFQGTAIGVGTGQLTFDTRQQVEAVVVNEGNGQRLQLLHRTTDELVITGTGVSEMGITEAAVGKASTMDVRSDIKLSPSLVARASVDFDEEAGRYVATAGSNTIAQQLSAAMRDDVDFNASGSVGVLRTSFQTYAATIVSQNARDTEATRTQLDYQKNLTDSLTFERSGVSGVNIDEEISNLILYQQSYSAAARVITTVNELMEVLVGIVK